MKIKLLKKGIVLITMLSLNKINAQLNFTEVITPFTGINRGSIAFSDIDNDNDQDVLITGYNTSSQPITKLYTNNGSGVFTEVSGTPFEGVYESSIAFSDIDNDNDQDVLITGEDILGNSITKLYINTGGSFTEDTGASFEGVSVGSIAFSDVDNDNDQDVLITGYNGSSGISKLYINTGGSFTEDTGTSFEGVLYSSIAFSDIDNDNDQDVLITGISSSGTISKLYTNNGSGVFTEVSGTPFDNIDSGSIAFSDIDNDNDNDVIITGLNTSYDDIAKLYTNNGSGVFTEVSGTPFVGIENGSIAFADIDNDNDQDVLISGANYLNSFFTPITKLYTNNGSGVFTEVSGTSFENVHESSIAFADIDNDNDNDVLITGKNDTFQKIAKLYKSNSSSLTIKDILNLHNVKVYPNPSNIELFIKGLTEISNYKIIDSLGKLILEGYTDENTSVVIQNLPNGFYFITLNNTQTFKFIKI